MKSLRYPIILLLFPLFWNCADKKTSPKLPNIIVFLVDDMGLMDSSLCFLTDENGKPKQYPLNDYYHTPNMEKMAKQGIRFSNFYAHSVCSPSRTSIMTGQNSARHKVTNWVLSEENNRTKFGPSDWNWEGIRKEDVTLPKLLKSKGYHTIHAGKAHFGPIGSFSEDPKNIGFDVNIAGNSIGQPGSYYGTEGFGHIKGQKSRAVPGLEAYHGKDIFLTEALTLEVKKAISKAHKARKPFFLNMAHYAVHGPFQSDPRFADKYKGSDKSAQAQAYATLIEGIDKSLGDLVAYLKTLGIADNTLILFLGDNGSDAPLPIKDHYSSSAPLKGKKGNHWEGGMRVPFIAAWAENDKASYWQQKLPIATDQIQGQMGSIIDIFPTICNLIDISTEATTLDGFDLSQQLKGQRNDTRKEIFLNHFPHGQHRSNYFTSLVNGDWKLVYHYPVAEDATPRYELFNLKKDPFETTNIAEKYPDELQKMIAVFFEEMKEKKALYPEKADKIIKPIFTK